jgi:tritrans,polycis-undecaprenyl-diphosphate synthase [geranylgeranyl-diphosphate specific]
MDGNRRFAQEQGIHTVEGHKLGGEKLGDVLEWCKETGIKILTVYAFSTENFHRSKNETNELMDLFAKNFHKLLSEKRVHKNKIRVRVFGQLSLLPPHVQKAAQEAMESTQKYDSYFFNLAIGYGGREEIIHAIKKIAGDVKKGELDIDSITTNIMPSYLYTSDLPDPDFVLRTSGEERLSNFLLWQLAYSELYFSDVYWPAFKKTDFLKAIRTYQKRQRRYGG